jgi:O-antigen/teichoic acid export membrane protein
MTGETASPVDGSPPAPPPHDPTVKKLFLRGSAWAVAQYGSGQLIRLGSNLILWRLLYPDAFGLMAIVNTFIVGLAMFSDIGIGQNVIRHERGDDPDFLNTIWTIQIVRGLVLAAIATLAAVPIAHFYHQPELSRLMPPVALGVALAAFNSTNIFSANRHMRLGRITIIDTASQVGSLVAMNIWAYLSHSVQALAGGAAIGAALKLILSHTALPGIRNRFRWEKTTLQEVSHFGRWIFVSTLLTFLASSSDRLIFGKLVSIEMLGVYSIAVVWATIPSYTVGHVVGNVLFPLFSRVKGSALIRTFKELRGTVLIASAWLVTCLIAGGPTLIRFLYDRRAVAAGPLVQILSIGAWFTTLEAANGAAILSIGKPKWLAVGNGAKLAAMVVLIPIFAKLFGFQMTVLAFSLTELVRYTVSAKACSLVGLNPIRQDAYLSTGIGVTALLGLGLAGVYQRFRLPISNTHLDAFLEGMLIFLLVTAIWTGTFLVRRRRQRRHAAVP